MVLLIANTKTEIQMNAAEWEVRSGDCTCGRYTFYHAGCGHARKASPYSHQCGDSRSKVTRQAVFCRTPAPCYNVDAVKLQGLCDKGADPGASTSA
jgi:hypothetical protein